MEFEIKGVKYRTAKLGVFEQLKVSRKLMPILVGVMSDFSSVRSLFASNDIEGLVSIILPKIAKAASDLSDEDCNAIIYPCLSVVSRHQQKSWVQVFSQGELMFDDITLPTTLQLVARVVGDSLGNFLQELPALETDEQSVE